MAEQPEQCPPRDATSRQFPGPKLTAAGGTIAMSSGRPSASSPLHDRIVLSRSEAELQSRRSGVAIPDATTCIMDLPPPQVMSTESQQDDTVADDRGASREQTLQVNKDGQTLIVPEVGKTYDSEEAAYDMYNTYAGKVGFSIRKNQTKRRHDGSIYQKYIVCSNEGHRETASSKDTTRTGCHARIQFSVSREGVWTVQKVVTDHNHYLASPNKVHKLRSQRRVIEADRHLIGQIREAGMKPSQVYDFMVAF
ncbi:protein FAR1-RELATED SEQUENCE 5-like [Triticum aestivum]|uniref:protein FAR1-RELATED SEQUENCE 5-like n=1 Tax=Triticum aestivum TaxID=4565 RepID=UPI001D01F8BA|nr:protein FAR1-RELATED SEQUENCE 5-like [Triticum aestivum]